MTTERVSNLLKKLERGLKKSNQFFESLDPHLWDAPVSANSDAWTTKQLVGHFVYSEEYLLQIAQDIASGGPGVPDEYDIDKFNLEETTKLPDLSPAELMTLLFNTRKATLDWVHTLDDSTLDIPGGHPVMGESNVEGLIFSIYAHQLLHMREVVPYMKGET